MQEEIYIVLTSEGGELSRERYTATDGNYKQHLLEFLKDCPVEPGDTIAIELAD